MMIIRKVSAILLLLCGMIISCGKNGHADTVTYTYDALNRLVKAEYGGGAYAEYVYDDTGNMTRKIFYETALLVRLAEFTAEISDGCVILRWKTLSEPDSAGFHILRSGEKDGEYSRVTEHMIAAEGEATQGSSYSYRDCGVSDGQIYYSLEDVDYRGVSRYEGTVSLFTAETPQDVNGVNTEYLSCVIRILQINAGMKPAESLNLKAYAGNDGKAGIEDAVWLLQMISGLRN